MVFGKTNVSNAVWQLKSAANRLVIVQAKWFLEHSLKQIPWTPTAGGRNGESLVGCELVCV